ncbi:MAG: HEAT repeat domain-containing protein, partial [Acidimicrobiia bacterium]
MAGLRRGVPTGPPSRSPSDIDWPAGALDRAAAAAAFGLRRPVRAGTAAALRHLVGTDPDPRVRSAALGALVRISKRRAVGPW